MSPVSKKVLRIFLETSAEWGRKSDETASEGGLLARASRTGASHSDHVAPPSMESSVKTSKTLLMRQAPPGVPLTVRVAVLPVEARVGLSRSMTALAVPLLSVTKSKPVMADSYTPSPFTSPTATRTPTALRTSSTTVEPGACIVKKSCPSTSRSATAMPGTSGTFAPRHSRRTLPIRRPFAKSTDASWLPVNSPVRGGKKFVGKILPYSDSLPTALTRMLPPAAAVHVTPPSMEISGKMSKKLVMRKFPSAVCRTLCWPSDCLVGLSRSMTEPPAPPPPAPPPPVPPVGIVQASARIEVSKVEVVGPPAAWRSIWISFVAGARKEVKVAPPSTEISPSISPLRVAVSPGPTGGRARAPFCPCMSCQTRRRTVTLPAVMSDVDISLKVPMAVKLPVAVTRCGGKKSVGANISEIAGLRMQWPGAATCGFQLLPLSTLSSVKMSRKLSIR